MPVDPSGRFFEGGKPIQVDGGIAVRAKRGKIGEQWWSRRFVDILERICDGGRLARGRTYARKGQVIDFDLTPGLVDRPGAGLAARAVHGDDQDRGVRRSTVDDRSQRHSAPRPCTAPRCWPATMPHEIVEVFDGLELPLFPSRLDMDCRARTGACRASTRPRCCTCWPRRSTTTRSWCWRGAAGHATRCSTPCAAPPSRSQTVDPLAVEEVPLESRLADFYAPGISLSRLRERPARVTVPPELLLRALDAPPIQVRHIPLTDLLRPAYRDLANPPT